MQINDELGSRLHDRATRGQPLSAEERAQLQDWYDEKDREEHEMLKANSPLWQKDAERNRLDSTLELAIARLDEVIRQNRQLAAQNEKLIALIESLRDSPSVFALQKQI
ncbi:MAG TPA: hypothetical protein PLD20_26725 [Blastocatellia bacterium]|nr:hypothetical protein [Blastocatellia bacterium]HMV82549.1 hypothetical protein [Blastocatellia bacterium]HMX30008.1 hypothetical protein [Blastocatellia bacterium]HMY75765.1 hypothetical protein [Blastocatellia bacterium]HMZ21557.1 hypothetical protein [Blastocatellia bacterium]